MLKGRKEHADYVNMGKFAALEDELYDLKREKNLLKKKNVFVSFIDKIVNREPKQVNRKKYIHLALGLGWFCGANRFYAGQKIRGILYLLFFWTGIPFSMTLIDLMIALPMKVDTDGNIMI